MHIYLSFCVCISFSLYPFFIFIFTCYFSLLFFAFINLCIFIEYFLFVSISLFIDSLSSSLLAIYHYSFSFSLTCAHLLNILCIHLSLSIHYLHLYSFFAIIPFRLHLFIYPHLLNPLCIHLFPSLFILYLHLHLLFIISILRLHLSISIYSIFFRSAKDECVRAPIIGSEEPRCDGSNTQWCSVTSVRASQAPTPKSLDPCGDPCRDKPKDNGQRYKGQPRKSLALCVPPMQR